MRFKQFMKIDHLVVLVVVEYACEHAENIFLQILGSQNFKNVGASNVLNILELQIYKNIGISEFLTLFESCVFWK